MTKAFEKKPEYDPLREQLWKQFGETPQGETIPWVAFERIIGVLHDRHPAAMLIDQFRNRLRQERKVQTTAEGPYRGVGVHLLTATQTVTDQQERRSQRARRDACRRIGELSMVPDESLSTLHRRLRAGLLHHWKTWRLMMSRGRKLLKDACKPTEVNPRRKVG